MSITWLKCSKKLPKFHQRVLVAVPSRVRPGKIIVTFAERRPPKWTTLDGGWDIEGGSFYGPDEIKYYSPINLPQEEN